MTGRYSRVKSQFWTDEKVRNWDDDSKLLSLYLLTSPHGNMLGYFVLPKLYACEDLKWEPEKLERAFIKLIEQEFIKYDDNVRLVFIPNYLKHNPIENSNQTMAAIKRLSELPYSPLLEDLAKAVIELDGKLYERSQKQFLKPLLEQLLEQLGEHNGNPVTVTVTVNRIRNILASREGDAGDVKTFLDYYHDKFLAKFGVKPVIDGGKDAMMSKRLLNTYGLEKLKGLMDAFLNSTDPFIVKSGYTIGVFKSQINKLLIDSTGHREQKSGGVKYYDASEELAKLKRRTGS